MATRMDQYEFVAIMAREYPHAPYTQIVDGCRYLMRMAARHQRACENECNGDYKQQGDYEREINRVEQRIALFCRDWSVHSQAFTPIFQHDPRGATVKLAVPSGLTNDWGRVGVCVP